MSEPRSGGDVFIAVLTIVVVSYEIIRLAAYLDQSQIGNQICYPNQSVEYVRHGSQVGAVCAGDGALYYKKKP